MQGPTFTPHPTYRVRQGPADETSDEGEEESFHGRPYARTPFPGQRYLGSPGSQNGGFIIPGGHQRCTFPLFLCFYFYFLIMFLHSMGRC